MKTSLSRSSWQAMLAAVFLTSAVSTAHAQESQSPIDFTSHNTTYVADLPPLHFTLSSDTPLTVINNGSPDPEKTAVRASVEPGAGSLTLSGREWSLAQFHFHSPAEDLLNGEASPMEMHLVFGSDDDLLVVSRWVDEGPFNSPLDPIFAHIPQTTDETLHVDHFNLNTLVPDNLASFRYSGSLTTPPFSEGVSWVQLAEPLYMSHDQINAFSSMFPEGDAREVQDLNGRIIVTDVPGFASAVPEPESYLMLLVGLGLIGVIANRRRRLKADDALLPI